ncbi:ankyrin repeat [Fusarium heterosporum]|uniref:Ankyrin repeat n=1 Tax=Fusarium heterosporum TaxID=42747 RepID=A0A8H5TXG6_FUSHE|nr:ankyrin repeat [Fusarium heterosporum]
MTSSMNSLPPLNTAILSDADNEDSSETESEASPRPQIPSVVDVNDDAISRASTECSEAPTLELLELSRPTSPEPHLETLLGLHRPWGLTEYNDYDVITVHGLRDDRSTCWKSKSGKHWLERSLFQGLSIRQLDYSYAIDESAQIYEKDGVKAEAKNLLRLYSENRRELAPLEVNRPIIWICHDIGGTIIKQVRHSGPFGPDIRKGVMTKIRDLARQVNDTNVRALDGSLFPRITNINVFYLPPPLKEGEPGYDTPHFAKHSRATAPIRELPAVPALPFSQYTLTNSHWMEAWSRFPQSTIDHLDLVRGDEGVEEDSWISQVSKRFAEAIYPLKVNTNMIDYQAAFHSVTPPRKYANVHLPLPGFLPPSATPAFLTQGNLRADEFPIGPQLTYICGLGDSAHTSMLSQYWQVFDARRIGDGYDASVFYFEFDKLDSRRNTIRSMLLAYLNEMSWYGGSQAPNIGSAPWMITNLNYYQSWSLSFLLKVFLELRCDSSRRNMPIFLACFDDCVEDERTWFLKEMLDEHNRNDMPFRLIITASDPDTSLLESAPEVQILTKKDFIKVPESLDVDGEQASAAEFVEEPMGLSVDEDKINPSGLALSLETLFLERPALTRLWQPLQDLITEVHSEPHLGFIMLNWLSGSGRRMSIASISKTIESLRPATPESIFKTIVGSLPSEKRQWAVLVYRWVRYAVEPLTIEALGHALVISEGLEDVSFVDIDFEQLADDLKATFAGMIVVDGRDVKLSHAGFANISLATMDGFHDEQPEIVHSKLAKVCLEYLMHSQVQTQYRSLAVENHYTHTSMRPLFLSRMNLLEYAVQYWVEHYLLAGPQHPFELAVNLFSNDEVRRKWAEAYYLLSNPFTRSQKNYFSPLPLMAALGLEDLVRHQLDEEQNSQSLNTDIWLAIIEAARNGHVAVVSILLNHLRTGENDLQDERHLLDALFDAALPGNEDVLTILVSKASSITNFRWPEYLYARAIVAGSISLVSALIRAGMDVNWTNHEVDEPALYTAIIWNEPSIAKLLLDAGADYGLRRAYGRTQLLCAAMMCRPEITQHLINAGASVEEKDEDGMSVVNTAVVWGDKLSLKILIDAGADIKSGDVSTDDNTCSPIVLAARTGSPGCLRILVENGADPLIEAEGGSILYHVCGFFNQFVNCRMLLERGADPNKKYPDKPMMLIQVLKKVDKELLELFLDHGAIPDCVDDWEETTCKTPLAHAARYLSYDFLRILLDKQASPNYCPNDIASPLQEAAYAGGHDTRKAELLLERGADLNWKRDDGWTPLQTAYDSPELVSLFLNHGADIERQTSSGTVLMMAAKWGYIDTLKTLVAHENSRPNLDTRYNYEDNGVRGYTALTFAVAYGCFDCANLLIDSGAKLLLEPETKLSDQSVDTLRVLETDIDDKQIEEMAKFMKACLNRGMKPDATDDDKNTFLHGIASGTPAAAVQVLIDIGVPIDTPNAAGMTPLAMAAQQGNFNAAKLLLSKYARADLYGPTFGNLLYLACGSSGTNPEDAISLVKLLIEAKANPHDIGPPHAPTLLCSAVSRRKLVRYLVETVDVRVNAPEGSIIHPIHVAAKSQDIRLFEYLLRHGADINLADHLGRRIVHYSTQMKLGNLTKWRLLDKSNADFLSADNYGRTPLHLVAAFGYLSEMQWFLRHVPNLDLNIQDGDGWTPLMWACKLDSSNWGMVELLTQRGADIWHKSKDGEWSALKLAHLVDMELTACEHLQPAESERDRVGPDGAKQTWDPLFHNTSPGRVHDGIWCDSCFLPIRGPRHKCTTCDLSFDLCFKCVANGSTMHDSSHEFEEYDGLETAGSVKDEEPAVENDGASVSSGSHKAEDIETEDSRSGDNDSEETDDDDSEA